MSLEQQLSDAIAAQNALTQAVATKKGEIDAATVAQQAAFDAWKGQFVSRAQQNLLRDSGRFFDPDLAANAGGARLQTFSLAFGYAGAYAALYNSTTVASAGKFTHDNSSNGGGGAVLPDPVKTLTDKMRGVGSARYGIEYYVAEFLMGASPTAYPSVGVDGVTRYLSEVRTLPVDLATHLAWVFAVNGSVSMGGATHRNGAASANPIVKPGDGWVHLASLNDSGGGGYIMPGFSAEPGTRFRVALPAVVAGDVRGFVHRCPILTQWH
jgi:hypothetical protein